MRLPFGYELRRLAKGSEAAPQTSVISVAASKRSWASPLGIDFDDTVRQTVDLALYDTIVNAVPFVDVALRKLARMVCSFEVECDNDTTADALNEWCRTCTVEDVFTGITPFLRPYVRQGLQYGKTAGEIVLAPSLRDVAGLCVIDAKRVRLCRTERGLEIGEDNGLGVAVPYPQQDLIVYSALNKEGDNPHGVSLLRSVPWVVNIALRMENALRQMWQRSGAPSFAIVHTIPDGIAIGATEVSERRASLESDWYNSQEARGNQEGIMDFVAALQGQLDFRAIGGDVKELAFVEPIRVFWEQVVSSVELAPFMLGLQWSTTERLSQQQADSIIGACDDIRDELEPDVLRILRWVQATRGLKGDARVHWSDVNLQDSVEAARAEVMQEQARSARIGNALKAWANGFIDQAKASEDAGYDGNVVMELDAPVMGNGGASADAGEPGGALAVSQAMWDRYP